MTSLPEFYYRVRENGAAVYRVDAGNRLRRIDLDQVAVLNLRTGEIRPHGGKDLTQDEIAEFRAWMDRRRETLAARDVDDIRRAVDHLNHVAQWAQARATHDQLETVTDDLLMAMHDLRNVLVRKKSQRAASSHPDKPAR